jgi:hypothetical protein
MAQQTLHGRTAAWHSKTRKAALPYSAATIGRPRMAATGQYSAATPASIGACCGCWPVRMQNLPKRLRGRREGCFVVSTVYDSVRVNWKSSIYFPGFYRFGGSNWKNSIYSGPAG